MPYSTAIFDLDGTLIDTLQDLADTANQMLAEYGHPQHQAHKYRYFVGDGLRVLIERIVPQGTSPSETARCIERFTEIYTGNWRRNSCPYPGIDAMLAGLKNAGLRLAVLSNKPHSFTVEHISHFFPEDTFELVLGQRPGVEKKPSPAGLIEITSTLNVPASECIYIGDTAVDMQTGKAAGMFTLGVLWGFRDQQELEDHKADLIVQYPMEIVQHAVDSL
jgi:phosphoglycolate phosphatase